MATGITHLLLDFFGTIVDYSPSRTQQDYSATYRLLQRLGSRSAYDEFLTVADEIFARFDERSAIDDREFSMREPSQMILAAALHRQPSVSEVDAFVETYLADWSSAVFYPDGMAELLRDLALRHRLAVVSNTHSSTLVPDHLRAMGVADLFDAVILSIDVGYRKPHPAMFRAALDTLEIHADSALFVGDTYGADYHGPLRAGIRALLIDPDRSAPIPDTDRLDSLFDLPLRDLRPVLHPGLAESDT
jgi:putative hydrolase of the HAD superfamily